MKNFLFSLGTILVLTLAAFIIGCSDENGTSADNNGQPVEIAAVTPADGSTNVQSDVSITLKFTGPVDTLSIMENFHLAGGGSMHEWRDSLDHYGGFGMMNKGMQDLMDDWMDSIHTFGQFRWNENHDSCEFVPDSTLMNGTDYLCLLNENEMRGRDGGMMGGAHHGNDGYHMFGFTTGAMTANTPELMATIPMDGSRGVETGMNFTMVFNMPMDTQSVMNGFHFTGGDAMIEWMDSLDHHIGWGGMGMVDMDHMMNWMDSIEHHGQFQWNETMDTCIFLPDSMIIPDMDYMMYLRGNIHGHNDAMMDMRHLQFDGHMIHFDTKQ